MQSELMINFLFWLQTDLEDSSDYCCKEDIAEGQSKRKLAEKWSAEMFWDQRDLKKGQIKDKAKPVATEARA